MNNRFRELALQAGAEFDWDPGTSGPEVYFNRQEDFEKFAELIALTCLEIVEAQKIVWDNTPVPAGVALDLASKSIASYFDLNK